MKKVEAIIKPIKLDDVTDALVRMGVKGLTAFDVRGFGRQRGRSDLSLVGTEVVAEFLPKTKLEVLVHDDEVEAVIDAISKAAHTGNNGDGKIFVTTVDDVLRIRTGERGEDAI
ncbi:MAG: P-II family nitrogen regulator [Deltaproteobacteria bacterium]|nr:P-II family nitrogen regulator [Deltaproteobacteria bacterium]